MVQAPRPGVTSQVLRLKNHGHVQPLIKKENATTAENAGIKKFNLLYMENTKMFKHPNYYKNLRKEQLARLRNRKRAISSETATAASERSPSSGQSDSQVVNQVELSSQSQASSLKQQASSVKPQAASKPEPVQVQASSAKRQASQPE